ncbi:AAA family ATPase [bacterium]|nr:AAA family ATPase [bacterium]
MTRVISIANQKGGVGKTTTAVNLSACIAVSEYKTLIIDMDPQSNAGFGFGFYNSNSNSLYDAFVSRCSIKDVIKNTQIPNLSLITSNKDLTGFEIEFVSMKNREFVLKDMLKPIRDEFQYIIIDCPPSMGLLTLNSLVSADYAIIPIQCEYYSLEGLSRLLESIKIIRNTLNKDLKGIDILLTMFDKRTNLSAFVEENVRDKFKEKVFKTTIPRNVRLSEAPSFGKPIILYDIKSNGAQAYLKLAKEVISSEKKTIR